MAERGERDMPNSDSVHEVVRQGTRSSAALLPLVYAELRQLAHSYLSRNRPGRTLQPTALVHEAYLRLARTGAASWDGKHHFFGAAATAMRRIMIEDARRRLALKRGGDRDRVALDDQPSYFGTSPEDLLALDEALASLEVDHPRLARVVVLRYFGGMTEDDVANLLGVSARTVRRDWVLARAFLTELLEGFPSSPQPDARLDSDA